MGAAVIFIALAGVAWLAIVFFGRGVGAQQSHVGASSIARPAAAGREGPPAGAAPSKSAAAARAATASPSSHPEAPPAPRHRRQQQGLNSF